MSAPSRPRILPLIYAVTITGILSNSLLAPAIPDILDEFDKPDSAAGLLVAVGSFPGIVVAPIIGIMADRLGRRTVLVPCLAVFGVAGLVAAAAPTYNVLLLARLAMGFGSAGMINLAVVLIGDVFPTPSARTKAVGRNSSVLTAGLAVAPLTSGLLTQAFSWRWALALYSLAAVTAVAAWVLLDRGRPASVGTIREQLGGAGTAIRNPVIVATLVSVVLIFALVFGVFLTVLPNHLEGEFGLSAGWRGVIIALPALSSTVSSFNLGRMNSRFGRSAIMTVSSMSWVASFVLLAVAPVLGVLVVGALIYGAGEGALIAGLQEVAVNEAPDEHRGAVVAVWVASARLGQSSGPLLAGIVLALSGTGAALWWGAGLAAMMTAYLVTSPVGRAGARRTNPAS